MAKHGLWLFGMMDLFACGCSVSVRYTFNDKPSPARGVKSRFINMSSPTTGVGQDSSIVGLMPNKREINELQTRRPLGEELKGFILSPYARREPEDQMALLGHQPVEIRAQSPAEGPIDGLRVFIRAPRASIALIAFIYPNSIWEVAVDHRERAAGIGLEPREE